MKRILPINQHTNMLNYKFNASIFDGGLLFDWLLRACRPFSPHGLPSAVCLLLFPASCLLFTAYCLPSVVSHLFFPASQPFQQSQIIFVFGIPAWSLKKHRQSLESVVIDYEPERLQTDGSLTDMFMAINFAGKLFF
jgi:hypothetical protein